ncbi:hypothetical protein AAVH_16867 [Aphelenchoides avenae]|nr:hypothetical protein AAVH_16867 [Aphelenchus avenae]
MPGRTEAVFQEWLCWLSRDDVDKCQLVCRQWHRIAEDANLQLPLRKLKELIVNTSELHGSVRCAYRGRTVTAAVSSSSGDDERAVEVAAPLELLVAWQNAFTENERLHLGELYVTILPSNHSRTSLQAVLKLLKQHLLTTLLTFSLVEPRIEVAVYCVLEFDSCTVLPSSTRTIIAGKHAERYPGLRAPHYEPGDLTKAWVDALLKAFGEATIPGALTQAPVAESLSSARRSSANSVCSRFFPCPSCLPFVDTSTDVVYDVYHADNAMLCSRLTLHVGYHVNYYRGDIVRVEMLISNEQCPALPSRSRDSLLETMCFLEREDLDSCDLASRSWSRTVRANNSLLSLREITSFEMIQRKKYERKHDLVVRASVGCQNSSRGFRSDDSKMLSVSDDKDFAFLLANAYVSLLWLNTLKCRPVELVSQLAEMLESAECDCIAEVVRIRMASVVGWVNFFELALKKLTVRKFEIHDVHYHLPRTPAQLWRRMTHRYPDKWGYKCYRFGKRTFHPVLLQLDNLTIKSQTCRYRYTNPCQVRLTSGISTDEMIELVLRGRSNRKRLEVRGIKWGFTKIFDAIIKTFPQLADPSSLPLRTEIDAWEWTKCDLPASWPLDDDSEVVELANAVTAHTLTIAVPWNEAHHPIFDADGHKAIILLTYSGSQIVE